MYKKGNGIVYSMMCYLKTETLKDKMKAGRSLRLEETDHSLTQLSDALSYEYNHVS